MLKSFVSEKDYKTLLYILEDIYNYDFANKISILNIYGDVGKTLIKSVFEEIIKDVFNKDEYFSGYSCEQHINSFITEKHKIVLNDGFEGCINKLNTEINEGFLYKKLYQLPKFLEFPPSFIIFSNKNYENVINRYERKIVSLKLESSYVIGLDRNFFIKSCKEEFKSYIKEKNAKKSAVITVLTMKKFFYKDLANFIGNKIYETRDEGYWYYKTI